MTASTLVSSYSNVSLRESPMSNLPTPLCFSFPYSKSVPPLISLRSHSSFRIVVVTLILFYVRVFCRLSVAIYIMTWILTSSPDWRNNRKVRVSGVSILERTETDIVELVRSRELPD